MRRARLGARTCRARRYRWASCSLSSCICCAAAASICIYIVRPFLIVWWCRPVPVPGPRRFQSVVGHPPRWPPEQRLLISGTAVAHLPTADHGCPASRRRPRSAQHAPRFPLYGAQMQAHQAEADGQFRTSPARCPASASRAGVRWSPVYGRIGSTVKAGQRSVSSAAVTWPPQTRRLFRLCSG